MHRFVLLLKRLLVFLPGLALAWLAAFRLFPWFHHRLPVGLAFLATYCLIAYLGLPTLMRLWRVLQKPSHVPTRSHEADGWAADPINLVILAQNEEELTAAMHRAGWLSADPATFKNNVRAIVAVILNRPYPTAPFEANYVLGKKQDLGFQIPVGNSPLKRHHVRFWRIGTTKLEQEHQHFGFWKKLLARFWHKEMQIWVGAVTYDRGINARKRNLQFGHIVGGDTVAEREFLINTLRLANALKEVTPLKAGEPLRTKHQHFGEKIVTDGYVTLCELKDVRTAKPARRKIKRVAESYQLLADPKTAMTDIIAEINKAKTSVAAQFYTFEADAGGLPLAEALFKARERGVRVRLMVDHSINFMHNDHYIHQPRLNRRLQASIVREWRATNQLLEDLRRAGIEIKMLNSLGFLRTKLLFREHKKLVAIDAENSNGICYMGGVNPSEHNLAWHDFMVRMTGSMTQLVHAELEDTWRGTSRACVKDFEGGQLITDVRGQSLIIPAAETLISQATKQIIIESPYLSSRSITAALCEAAERGVPTSAIIPGRNNWSLFDNRKTLAELRAHGVQVYRYQEHGGMTHAKVLLADKTCLFGSSNFSEFMSGRLEEAGIITANASFVKQIKLFLEKDLADSRQDL